MTIIIGDHITLWRPTGPWINGPRNDDGSYTFKWRTESRIVGYLEQITIFPEDVFLHIWVRDAWGHFDLQVWELTAEDSVENHSRYPAYVTAPHEMEASFGDEATFELRRNKVRS